MHTSDLYTEIAETPKKAIKKKIQPRFCWLSFDDTAFPRPWTLWWGWEWSKKSLNNLFSWTMGKKNQGTWNQYYPVQKNNFERNEEKTVQPCFRFTKSMTTKNEKWGKQRKFSSSWEHKKTFTKRKAILRTKKTLAKKKVQLSNTPQQT